MQEAVGKPIAAIEREFTRQEGLPLVRVTGTPGGARLAQARFADDPATIAGLPPRQWHLPLAVAPTGGATHETLLHGTADLAEAPPLLVNAGQQAYARVLYDESLFDGLALQFGRLAPVDQMGLLNDAWALGVAGYTPATRFLRLVRGMPADGNAIVWQRVVERLRELDDHYADTPQRAAFRRFALGLLAPLAARLAAPGTSSPSPSHVILRSLVDYTQAVLGDAAVVARARARFERREGPPEEQRSDLWIVGLHADADTFNRLLDRARRADDPLEKEHLFQALGNVSDRSLARRMVAVALSDQVPAGGGPPILGMLARQHPDLVWAMVAPRLDDPKLPFDTALRWTVARGIAACSADPQRIADLEAYEARSVPADARKPFLAATASIRRNERFRIKVLPEMDRWIGAQDGTGVVQ
jgi:aminopeptidase N